VGGCRRPRAARRATRACQRCCASALAQGARLSRSAFCSDVCDCHADPAAAVSRVTACNRLQLRRSTPSACCVDVPSRCSSEITQSEPAGSTAERVSVAASDWLWPQHVMASAGVPSSQAPPTLHPPAGELVSAGAGRRKTASVLKRALARKNKDVNVGLISGGARVAALVGSDTRSQPQGAVGASDNAHAHRASGPGPD